MKKLKSFIGLFLFAALTILTNSYFGSDGISFAPIGVLGAVACKNLQTRLVDYFGRNISLYRTGGSTAFIKWLLSPQNTRNFQRINVESIPGKKRGVAFRVDLPYCFSLCALDVSCTAENIQYVDPDSGEMVFDLTSAPFRHCDTNGNPVRLRFKEESLMKYCTETDQSYITDKIAQYLLEWEQGLDKALATLIGAQVGTNGFDTPAAITNVPLFITGNNTTPGVTVLNPDAVWLLDQMYADIGLPGQYGLVGGTLVSKLAFAQRIVSANDAGVDLSKYTGAQNQIPFYDRNFNTIYGQGDAIMFAPGTAQLVTWNKYKGEKRRAVTDLYSKGTVTLPTTGLEVDWKWWYDYDCEEWIYEAFLYAELAVVPPGGCLTQHAGVNGIIRIHDCGVAPIIPVCPEPEA